MSELFASLNLGFPCSAVVKNLLASIGDTRDAGLIPGLGRSPGGGNGNPLQYFGHLMRRVDSLEKTLMLGGIWGQEEKGMTEDEMAGWHH